MSGDSQQIVVPRLEGVSNYSVWRLRVMDLLVLKEVWEPVVAKGEVNSTKDAKARSYIRSTVQDHLLVELENCKTAKEAWQLLEGQFQSKAMPRRMQLEQELTVLKQKPGETVSRFAARAWELQGQLVAAGSRTATADRLAFAVLFGLSERFSITKQMLQNTMTAEPTLEEILPRLVMAEEQLGLEQSQEKALFAGRPTSSQSGGQGDSSSSSKPGGQDRKARVKCFACGKYGHHKSECPERQQQKQKEQPRPRREERGRGSQQGQRHQGQPQQESLFFTEAYSANTGNLGREKLSPGAAMQVRWVLDSGASRHMTPHAGLLHSKRELPEAVVVGFGNCSTAHATVMGSVLMQVAGGQQLELKDVLLVPEAAESLLSVRRANSQGLSFGFSKSGCCQLVEGGTVLAETECGEAEVHRLTAWCSRAADSGHSNGSVSYSMLADVSKGVAQLWHKRYCHLGYSNLARLLREQQVTGVSMSEEALQQASKEVCEPCVLGRQHRDPFPSSSSVSARPLELVHMDLCGPLEESSGGSRYFLTVLDDFSKLSVVCPLALKSSAAAAVQHTLLRLEKQSGQQVSQVRSENGLEFCNRELDSYLSGRGIQHQTSVRYSPQQNGAAERLNRTLVEKVRCMLAETGLPKSLWAEALLAACYVRNRGPVAGQKSTPWERFTGQKPDVSHLRVFGSRAFVLIPNQLRGKLDQVSQAGRLVGYAANSKGYRVLLVSRDVRFDEQQLSLPAGAVGSAGNSLTLTVAPGGSEAVGAAGGAAALPSQQELVVQPGAGQPAEELVQPGAAQQAVGQEPAQQEPADARQRPVRAAARQPAGAWRDSNFEWAGGSSSGASAHLASVSEPATMAEALASPQAAQWKAAMNEEVASLLENGTWTVEKAPAGVRPLPVKWVYTVKRDAAGAVARYKARLVAKGCMQREGIDYDEVFAPVSKYSTVRAVLAVTAAEDLELHQLDFKTAFLNGELEELVYTEQPPGYEQGSSGAVCRLHKSI